MVSHGLECLTATFEINMKYKANYKHTYFCFEKKKKTLIGLTSNLIYYNNKESDFIADNLAYKEMIMMLIKRQAKCLRDHLFGMVGLGLFSRRHLI